MNLRRRKTLVILVVAMLFLTTIAVGSVSCDGESSEEEPSNDSFGEFSWEDGSGDGAGTCGGGDPGGDGGPQ